MTTCTWDYTTYSMANRSYTMTLCCFVFFIPLGVILYCYLFMFFAIRDAGRSAQGISHFTWLTTCITGTSLQKKIMNEFTYFNRDCVQVTLTLHKEGENALYQVIAKHTKFHLQSWSWACFSKKVKKEVSKKVNFCAVVLISACVSSALMQGLGEAGEVQYPAAVHA